MTNPQVDLSRLAIDRSQPRGSLTSSAPRWPKWPTRVALPSAILLGFAALLLASSGISFRRARTVEVIPAIVKRTESHQSGTPLFQAAGWVEPRPTAVSVPALAPGVIEELLVVEGQAVQKGEPIAKLITIDAEIAVRQARTGVASACGELQQALAEQKAARVRLESPFHLQAQLADANSALARTTGLLEGLPWLIHSAEAAAGFAEKNLDAKRAAGEALSGAALLKAESEFAAAAASLQELQQRKGSLVREQQALQEKAAALQSQLELLVEETRQLEEASGRVQSATALHDAAKLHLQLAELALERNVIRAPMDGRILRLVMAPGMRVMAPESGTGQGSGAVVEMYDPSRLQVRADVRLDDIPLVHAGQLVEMETAASEKTIQGRVLQPNSSANVQKNTLEVKVEIIEPVDDIRPEMLVTATFLASGPAVPTGLQPNLAERVFVPEQLVRTGGSDTFVWLVDANSRARKKSVDAGRAGADGLVEIVSGLNPTDKLVASDPDGLQDGSLVRIGGEDSTLGRQ